MFSLIVAITIGFILGRYQMLPAFILKYNDHLINLGVVLLLFSMGIQIGLEDNLISKLGIIGWKAFILAGFAILFSVLILHVFINRFLNWDNPHDKELKK